MGLLLNTLAKYVKITGGSQNVFKREKSSPPHVYFDVDLPSNMMKNLSMNICRRKITAKVCMIEMYFHDVAKSSTIGA